MKKALLIVLIATLFVLTACSSPDVATDTTVVEEEPVEEPIVEEEPVDDIPEIDAGEGNLFIGDSVEVAGKRITLKSVNNDGEVLLSVGGKEYLMFGTKRSEIFEGLLIEVTELNFDFTQEDNIYIQLSVEPWETGEDEYIMHVGDSIKIGEKSVKLDEVKIATFPARVIVDKSDNEGLKLDTPKVIEGLEFTLLKSSARPHQVESYIHVKIVPEE